ncbi:hypothetical protein H4Q26_007131 [Puccinia striiformis f. sp. tritici PST-130]|nr:hypothetical protein H4Q26_007131 [Puccinia striiformis f. sp. tritici PST-130]
MEQFFPVVAIKLRQGMYYKEPQALRELTFKEKALMSSTTIKRNGGRAAFLEEVERSITSNHRFHDLQSQLLKLRIKRYRAKALVDELPKGSNTNSDSEADTNRNHEAAAVVHPHA